MMKNFLLSSVVAVAFAGAANAADVMPPPAPVDWTGFWIGAGVGGQIAVGDASVGALWYQEGYPTEIDQSAFADGDINSTSFLGTIGAGADYQFGESFVVGVFGDYTFAGENSSKIDGGSEGFLDQPSDSPDGPYGAGIGAEISVGNNWTIGGRIGFLVKESTLIYGLAGYTQADAEFNALTQAYEEVAIPGAGQASTGDSEWLDGFTVGGGIETMLTDNISGKLEYRYTDLGSFSPRGDVDVDSALYDFDGFELDSDIALHSIRATIGWRFY
jgi:outer membrane immunogenic protein